VKFISTVAKLASSIIGIRYFLKHKAYPSFWAGSILKFPWQCDCVLPKELDACAKALEQGGASISRRRLD